MSSPHDAQSWAIDGVEPQFVDEVRLSPKCSLAESINTATDAQLVLWLSVGGGAEFAPALFSELAAGITDATSHKNAFYQLGKASSSSASSSLVVP